MLDSGRNVTAEWNNKDYNRSKPCVRIRENKEALSPQSMNSRHLMGIRSKLLIVNRANYHPQRIRTCLATVGVIRPVELSVCNLLQKHPPKAIAIEDDVSMPVLPTAIFALSTSNKLQRANQASGKLRKTFHRAQTWEYWLYKCANNQMSFPSYSYVDLGDDVTPNRYAS